jgi:hypothetical protein
MNKHSSKKRGEECQQHLARFTAMANQAPDNPLIRDSFEQYLKMQIQSPRKHTASQLQR